MAQQILFISTRRTHQVKECMDMCLYLNSNVLSLQAMSKQWKIETKMNVSAPCSSYFLVLLFHFQSDRSADVAWSGIWISTWQCSFSLQTLAAECCTETHGWSSCIKLFYFFDLMFLFILAKIEFFHNIFVHEHWFANFIFPHRIAGGLWDWTFWSMAKPKHNHHNWI